MAMIGCRLCLWMGKRCFLCSNDFEGANRRLHRRWKLRLQAVLEEPRIPVAKPHVRKPKPVEAPVVRPPRLTADRAEWEWKR